MPGVIADTGPINYLILIHEIDLLPKLFGSILIPDGVADELSHMRAPAQVRDWIANIPPWVAVQPAPPMPLAFEPSLDHGERCVISLAAEVSAERLLLDDRQAVAAATARGFVSLGTLGILVQGTERGLTDLPAAFERLKATSFRVRPSLLEDLVKRHTPPPP
jgi:predicted nucleic acid-binding protein